MLNKSIIYLKIWKAKHLYYFYTSIHKHKQKFYSSISNLSSDISQVSAR